MCGRFSDIQPARRLPLERFSREVVRSPLEISRGERTTSQVLPRNGRGGQAWLAGDPGARRGPGGSPGTGWLGGDRVAGRGPGGSAGTGWLGGDRVARRAAGAPPGAPVAVHRDRGGQL